VKSTWILRAALAMSILGASARAATAQDSPEMLPKVIQHAEPTYPAIARAANIQGDVLVQITTDGESVQKAEAQTGPPMLRKAAEDNARTWKFAAHSSGTFHVIFRYKIFSGNVEVAFLESSGVVQLEILPPAVYVIRGSIDIGKWRAQLRSAHGRLSEVFDLSYSGPNDEWLSVDALSSHGESEEEEFGYKGGDFLAFTIKLEQPDGKRLDTFLVGRMAKDKIVGTFVDEAGTSGKWTAVRTLAPKEK
jgi:hypothetical protein